MGKEFIVEMSARYPFGQLGETITEDTSINVCKKLHFSSEEEYDTIQHMIHFLKAARHENLVNLEKALEEEDRIELFYEYVPFRLEKWLLDINEELLHSLQEQMLELAQYLCRSSIRFTFDPESIGLTENMTIKYFLNQFAIDLDNSEQNLVKIQKDIEIFFKELMESKPVKTEEEKPSKDRMLSLSTNGSLSHSEADNLSEKVAKRQSAPQRQLKGTFLSARVENSKKKCLEIIERFRKMNMKQ